MVKKFIVVSFCLLLVGCMPFNQQEEEQPEQTHEEQEEQIVEAVPQVSTPDRQYRSVLYDGSYLHGESRGFGSAVVYNRLDLDQLELGLMQIAMEYFSPDRYFFREGQFIDRTELNEWLMRYDEQNNPNGLNPPLGEGSTMKEREENKPRYLSHILEHNYLVQDENGQFQLGGIVIGLSMNSVYNFRVEDEQGLYHFYEIELRDSDIEREGELIAQEVVNRLRDPQREDGAFQQIPIVVALFKEQPRESVIPGHFFAKAEAEPHEPIQRWQKINERYYLFPSSEANEEARNEADHFQRFQDDIQTFFDNYIGVVGKGRYIDNQIQEMTIDVQINYEGKAEIVALSQYIVNQLQERFSGKYKISVAVVSVSGKTEAVIVQNPDEEPFIHILS